jgi:hypothetical protein
VVSRSPVSCDNEVLVLCVLASICILTSRVPFVVLMSCCSGDSKAMTASCIYFWFGRVAEVAEPRTPLDPPLLPTLLITCDVTSFSLCSFLHLFCSYDNELK